MPRMNNMRAVVKQLQRQRDGVQRLISQLDSALSVLGGLDGASKGGGRGGRRHLSAAARARIAAAQRKRWAKWKAKR
jgi:hypothetical protein